ncbi:hypothetical protein [Paraburkholderia sp. HP33-1]|uniref:hypothetical protein n=1 Tax=Paraburkholderia sp. HP33-1 TaxID=2883243 RepID=UPI001F451155|nr:hypothetical protein [Paraburkholderia sp. HP33-1]
MGIGMEIVYLGFPGAAQLEAEAGVQLLRLARFGALVSTCHLAIEAMRPDHAGPHYDVRLDLITSAHEFRPIAHCSGEDAEAAIRGTFDLAEQELETIAARARTH